MLLVGDWRNASTNKDAKMYDFNNQVRLQYYVAHPLSLFLFLPPLSYFRSFAYQHAITRCTANMCQLNSLLAATSRPPFLFLFLFLFPFRTYSVLNSF